MLNALRAPIPRTIYNSTVKYPDIDLFLQTLYERQRARKMSSSGHIPSASLIPLSSQQNVTFQSVGNCPFNSSINLMKYYFRVVPVL